jgi:membrane protein required for colicin V production
LKALDIILLILLIIGGYRGFKRGLLLEIIGMVALLLAIMGGMKLMQWGMEVLRTEFNLTGKLISILSFILIFVAIVILVSIIGRLMKNVVHLTLLGSVDKLAGSILGIFKWAFGLSIILWFFSSIGFSMPDEISLNTYLYPEIYGFAPMVIGYMSNIFPFIGELFRIISGYIN